MHTPIIFFLNVDSGFSEGSYHVLFIVSSIVGSYYQSSMEVAPDGDYSLKFKKLELQ